MNKTYAADSITTNNALARLTTSCEALEAHDVTAQNTLVQLQWALETEHKENVDHFATLKARLDLLQHVQEQHSAQGPRRDHEGGNKSIEIKFTTDESGDMDDQGEGYVTTTYSNHNSPRRNAAQKTSQTASSTHSAGSPQVTKSTHRGGSAFLTESDPSMSAPSSPDKSHSFLQAYEVFKKAEESRLSSAQNSPMRTGSESPNKPTRRSFDFDQSSVHSVPVGGNASANVSVNASQASAVNTSTSTAKASSASSSVPSSVAKAANDSAVSPRSANTSTHSAEAVNTSTISSAASAALVPEPVQEDEESELSFEREERLQASFARGSPPLSSTEQSPSSLRRSDDREDSPEPSHGGQQDNSWDQSQISPARQDSRNVSASRNDMSREAQSPSQDVSSSRIPMHSAFDMSMPSYVSHIDSSEDANQSSFGYPINSGHGSAAVSGSGQGSPSDSPVGKLSIGSQDSLDNLNNTFEELRRHKETLLETTRSAQKLTGNNSHNTSFASPTSPVSPPNKLEDTVQSMRYQEESESEDEDEEDEHSASDRDQSVGGHSDQDSDLDDDEFDRDSGSGSGPGDFSQIDLPLPVTNNVSVAPPAAPVAAAVSMVNNSWDASTLPDSPNPTRTATNQSAVNVSTASNLSASTASSTASSAAGRAKIPSLNMASLPPSSPNPEPPSDRSVNRNQPDRTGVSDWDPESSFASDSTGATPPRPLNSSRQTISKTVIPPIALTAVNAEEEPSLGQFSSRSETQADVSQSPDRMNRSAMSNMSQTRISALDMSSINQSPPRLDVSQSKIIGASDVSPPPKQRPGFDDSTLTGTAGSVSDSSASTSDYSASSHSYLTVGSISPQKAVNPPVVPAAATAKPTAPVVAEPAMSIASSVSTSTISSATAPPPRAAAAAADVSADVNTSKMSIK